MKERGIILITLNYRDNKPIYEQIKDGFKKMIVNGSMQGDEKMPSVRSLASSLSINPNTIQRAYSELENEGYIYGIAGKGNFVSPVCPKDDKKIETLKKVLAETLDELKYLGIKPEELAELIKGDNK